MCVFCDIIENIIPSKKIYEDGDILAILDISQTTKGHTLVIPKKHYDNMNEIDDLTLSKIIVKTNELSKVIVKNLGANGFNLLVNTNEVAGQTVKHAHFHIIPRYSEKDTISIAFNENKFDLDEILKEIKK